VPSAAPILCDLDGVVWLMHQPIAGSVNAIESLRNAGHRVLFVTNNSFSVVADQENALANIGIDAHNDVVTSSQAAGALLRNGERVLLGGGPGAVEAIMNAGAILAGRSDDHIQDISDARKMNSEFDQEFEQQFDQQFDVVMVGFHPTFDYRGLTRLSNAVRNGARLIATNDDATYPTPHGLIPGGGSILAAVAAASGVEPIIAGKPHRPMADLVRQVLGINDLSDAWMVGDRPSTDGLFAQTVGCKFAQVLTGISSVGDINNVVNGDTHVFADLATFAKIIVGSKTDV
jgi:HAD superfamily hydrolase (TIGR01450 family)